MFSWVAEGFSGEQEGEDAFLAGGFEFLARV